MAERIIAAINRAGPIGIGIGALVVLMLIVFSCAALANNLADMDKQERCELRTKTEMYGATQRLRGADRSVKYISRASAIEMMEHGLGAESLYILDDPEYTQEEREFLEDSATRGYDLMAKWKKANPDAAPIAQEWAQGFMAECMAGSES